MKRLLVQIVTENGEVIRFPGGRKAESDLVELLSADVLKAVLANFEESIVENVMSRGVGIFRTEKHVRQDVHDGIQDAMTNSDGVLKTTVSKAVKSAVQTFKARTVTG